jgi:hypothetical protein
MRGRWLLAALVLLSGCTRVLDIAGEHWIRANTSIQQETSDEMECARDSEPAGNLPDTFVGGLADMIVVPLEDRRRGAAYDRCMVTKGYTPVDTAQR